MFLKHLKNGFITITTSKEDPDVVARDMQKRDNSAPLTPSSPELNKPDEKEEQSEGIVAKAVRVMKG
jgi:hypothetical protein